MPSPVTGTQTINIPTGKLVFVEGFAQSSGTQVLKVTDSTGKVVVDLKGASSSGGVFTSIGSATFTSAGNGTYTVDLTPNAGILGGESVLDWDGRTYLQTYTFLTNDGGIPAGDTDINDLLARITVYTNRG